MIELSSHVITSESHLPRFFSSLEENFLSLILIWSIDFEVVLAVLIFNEA